MCKLAFAKTVDGTAYTKCIEMISHQEHIVAGHSTGIAWIDSNGTHLRKSVGKVINFKAKYPRDAKTNIALGHSRYATCGAITESNQHPISIMYKGKRIGYGIHNGVWSHYKDFEYMRNRNLSNVTDSALLFTIYSDALEKYGDSPSNRRKALGTMRTIVKGENNNNFILMFDDGQTIFSGNVLTYKEGKTLGIMTFGLPNKTDFSHIYEVRGQRVLRFSFQHFNNYVLVPKPPKQTPVLNTPKPNPTTQTHLNTYHRFFDGKAFFLTGGVYTNQQFAQNKGEFLKKNNNIQYRTVKNEQNKWQLYVRGKIR